MNLDATGIYCITNIADGKNTTYIGSTLQSFKHRWATHKARLRGGRHCNCHLQRAWNKYGEGAFVFAVVEQLDTADSVERQECAWLDFYRLYVPIYNLSTQTGRNGRLGHPMSEEARAKIREATSGKNHYMYGRTLPAETKERIRRSTSGERNPFYGRRHSDETVARMRAIKRGDRNPFYGRKHTTTTKEKIRKAKTKPYPAFQHRDTREVIPAGMGITALCQERGLSQSAMSLVVSGKRPRHKGWELVT